jgi:hypothetical protein
MESAGFGCGQMVGFVNMVLNFRFHSNREFLDQINHMNCSRKILYHKVS